MEKTFKGKGVAALSPATIICLTIKTDEMKLKKLIHYRLGVSRHFPAEHPRKGEPTYFIKKILNAIEHTGYYLSPEEDMPQSIEKIHTIRANYPLWAKRFEKINKGEAVIDLFYWSGSPYNYKRDGSKQVVFATLTREDGIGIQKLQVHEYVDENEEERAFYAIDDKAHFDLTTFKIAQNDGLSQEDFKAWFKGYDLTEPMAIIHFTSFRY